MRVDPKALVRRLNPACTRMLEAAVVRAAGGQFYEITCEHMLLKVLEPEDGDASRVLHHFGQPRGVLLGRLQRALEGMKTGNAGRPVFAETLFQWFEDAWVIASLNYDAQALRAGHLLLAFIARSGRYTGERFPELDAIPIAELRERITALLEDAPESKVDAAATGTPAAAGGEGALDRFTTSFTDAARAGKIDPIFGRHREIRQVIDILARRRKNNPIIVGEPGVGKTALVEGLALAIVAGDVPEQLRDVELRSLDLGLLQAGASVKGEFEKRLKGVIAEVKASPRNIILFIDE
ncbi:MAG: AAA family ATPase, partial [Myxococcales bacterium]|nr:AAA family ATPase [Myxococcales bacterium]